jgi:hypothetical protein
MTEETTQRKHPLPEETREHLKAAREEMRKSVETLLPPGFVEHRRAARKEFLMAARSFLDAAIKRIDEK